MALRINYLQQQVFLKRTAQALFIRSHSSYTTKKITKKIQVTRKTDTHANGKQSPLCLILGWGNSKQNQLKKYSEIYEKRGFNTITVSPLLIDALVFPQTKGKKISDKVVETILKEFQGEKIPIVLHQFSNGGCALYYFICEEFLKEKSVLRHKIHVAGTVFDSCPVVPNFDSINIAQRVFTNEIQNLTLKTIVWYSLRFFLPFVLWLNPVVKVFMESMQNFPVLSPQLFLYSENDMFAPYKDIDKFIESRKDNGVETMAKRWTDTPHVRHFMAEPEVYEEMIDKFIKKLSL